jgi:hypothetical protein
MIHGLYIDGEAYKSAFEADPSLVIHVYGYEKGFGCLWVRIDARM